MNIKRLNKKIIYENLKLLSTYKLIETIKRNQLFNDIDFIDCFKDYGYIFWSIVIYYTKIPIKKLIKKYKDYIFDPPVYHSVYGSYWRDKNINLGHYTMSKNLETYFNAYENKTIKQ